MEHTMAQFKREVAERIGPERMAELRRYREDLIAAGVESGGSTYECGALDALEWFLGEAAEPPIKL